MSTDMDEKPRPRRRLPYVLRIIRARPRLTTSALVGIAVIALLPAGMTLSRRLLIGWDAGIALYLVLVYTLMARAEIGEINRHAARQDEGRFGVLVLTVFAALASLGAILAELGVSPGASRTATQLALATTTIALSWAFTHTIFALHYAHDFYGDYGGKRSGLNFPGEEEPDYWDFVYFSFVIGMTSQVSDVAVTSQLIRRTVNAHGIVSFFFNATLLALTVNIAASAI
jgi:uncharacterized membrane protein